MEATRKCFYCKVTLPKSEYSKAQWSKKKNDGQFVSGCKVCVDGDDHPSINNGIDSQDPMYKCLDKHSRQILYRIENPMPTKPHPDLNKNDWVPSKTMNITSGRFCFGLPQEVQSGATEDPMTFESAAFYYGDYFYHPSPHNTVAKNGKWLAYKLIDRDTSYDEFYDKHYPNKKDDERIAGWFICHEDIDDPLAEVCKMVYNTFSGENGGYYGHWCHVGENGRIMGMSNNTHPFHVQLGYILIARYAMGVDEENDDDEEEDHDHVEDEKDNTRVEGLCIVDYADAKMKESSTWANSSKAICNIYTYGDFDIGRLKYNSEGLCEAFLLTGSVAPFQHIHFTSNGTAPLGKESEDWEAEEDKESTIEKVHAVVVTRECTNCGIKGVRSDFSKNQWAKKKNKDGKSISTCKYCVEEKEQAQSGTSNANMIPDLKQQQEDLNKIFTEIQSCEVKMQDPYDGDASFMFDQLDLQKKHWQLCYRREEQLEKMRTWKVYYDWQKCDFRSPRNVDGDNMECVLCNTEMVLDGEYDYNRTGDHVLYRANRLACCGARYCLKRCHKKDLPESCPSCNSTLVTAENATKDDLLLFAENGKTWAQLELAERYDKVHSSVIDDAIESSDDYDDHEYHYENNAILWARKASDGDNNLASVFLGRICHNGGIRTSSHSWSTFYDFDERTMLMKRAADTGDCISIVNYAERAEYESRLDAWKYYTLCAYLVHDQNSLGRAYSTLAGDCESMGSVKERQLYLYEQGALNGNAAAMAGLAYCLNNQCIDRYGSCSNPKYSQLPKIYFWAKKSAEMGCREGITVLEDIKNHAINSDECACFEIGLCVNKKNRQYRKKLFPCERCETVFFCSDVCRIAFDDIVGHKQDCCSCSDCVTKKEPHMGFADWKRHDFFVTEE